ncbi:hypothetical protein LTR66_010923 [Elasticomyces elasticus]|nr:hypothetical protein LTR66_010923 [Elasticomyces elasticus]
MAIPPGSLVLITFRDLQRCGWLESFFSLKYGASHFSLVQVSDLAADHAFDAAAADCSGIAHVAAIRGAFSATEPRAIIQAEITGALNVLTAAAQQPSIERVVFTSSFWAAYNPRAGVPYTLPEWTYNEAAIEAAWNSPQGQVATGQIIFSANKAQTDRAMWERMREHKPGFVFNVVVPATVFGRILHAAVVRRLLDRGLSNYICQSSLLRTYCVIPVTK